MNVMPPLVPWDSLQPGTRRVILETAMVPPIVLVAVVVPALLVYVLDASPVNTVLLIVTQAALYFSLAWMIRQLLRTLRDDPASAARKAG